MTIRSNPIRVLLVVNKVLRPGDYRLEYALLTKVADVTFAMPGYPAGIGRNRVVPMQFGEGLSVSDVRGLWQLYSHLRRARHEYDVVHFFSTKLQLIGPAIASHFGLTSIFTVTGLGRAFNRPDVFHRSLRSLYRMLLRLSESCAARILFQNSGDRRTLEECLPGIAKKSVLIGSAVVAPVVTTKEFDNGPLRVLVVGRLMRDKGIELVLDIARQLHRKGVVFTVAGPPSVGEAGLYKDVLQAAERGIVNYVGDVAPATLQRIYAEHHVLLFLSSGEGMARVMLEGGHGLLCPVASNIAANRDLIDRPNRGFLIDPDGRVEHVARILEDLRDNRDVTAATAALFQQSVVQKCGIDRYVMAIDKILTSQIYSVPSGAETPTAT